MTAELNLESPVLFASPKKEVINTSYASFLHIFFQKQWKNLIYNLRKLCTPRTDVYAKLTCTIATLQLGAPVA